MSAPPTDKFIVTCLIVLGNFNRLQALNRIFALTELKYGISKL